MASNPVSPDHYKGSGGIQAIDVIEQFGLNYRLGNVVKYLLRAGKKDDRLQDLQKALAYLTREVTGQWPGQDLDKQPGYDKTGANVAPGLCYFGNPVADVHDNDYCAIGSCMCDCESLPNWTKARDGTRR